MQRKANKQTTLKKTYEYTSDSKQPNTEKQEALKTIKKQTVKIMRNISPK